MSKGQGFFILQGKVLSLKKSLEMVHKPFDTDLPSDHKKLLPRRKVVVLVGDALQMRKKISNWPLEILFLLAVRD